MEGREGGGLFRAFNPAATSSSKSASTSASTSAGRQPPSPSAELPVSRGPSEVLPQGRHYRAHRPDDASRPAADVSTRASTGRGHSGSHQPVHPLAAATSASGVRHETASASVAGRPNSTDSAPAVAAASSALGTPAGATVQTATPPVASGLPATAAAAPTATGQAHLGTPAAPPPTAPATAAQTGAAAATAAAAAATVTHTEAAAAASTSGGSSRPKLRMRKGEKGAVNEYQTSDYLETSSHALTLETETLLSSSLSPYSSPSEQYSIEHSIQYDPRLHWIPQAVRLLCVALLLLSAWLVVAIFQMHSVALKVALMRGVPVGSLSSTNWGVPWRQVQPSCTSKEQEELHQLLKGIVLIINTNYEDAARGTSDFLRSVYGRLFDQVVVISQTDIPDMGVEARGPKLYRSEWMYAYFHLPKVMAAHPEADGYLWTNDDVALNYWRLRDADRNKLWMANNLSSMESKFFPFDQTVRAQYEDSWAGGRESRDRAWNAFRNLDDRYQEVYKNSLLPLRDVFPKRMTDVFYIPKRFASVVSFDLIPIFREYKVWSEVGVPMMFYALDEPKNFDPIFNDMKVVWDREDYVAKQDWRPDVSCVHPWKLSKNSSKAEFLTTLGSHDPCLLQLLPLVSRPSH